MARRSKFQAPVNAENAYNQVLRRIARLSAGIIEPHIDGDKLINSAAMMAQLRGYADLLDAMAKRVSLKMLVAVNKNSERAFMSTSKTISRELRETMASTVVGVKVQELQRQQVALIKSLPIEAGERAQRLALSAVTGGRRPSEVAEELMRTEGVTLSRATLIARTESAKAASALTEARSVSVGSDAYIWRTAGDSDVRESHADMENETVRWVSPPTLDGMTGHAGNFPNCRCFAEPIFSNLL
jgi:SPP1 gp7 family putative phage head morphogenesis protein